MLHITQVSYLTPLHQHKHTGHVYKSRYIQDPSVQQKQPPGQHRTQHELLSEECLGKTTPETLNYITGHIPGPTGNLFTLADKDRG